MVLKFKDRTKEPNLKKVLIYGMDGSGKSTFAEQYCKENNLNAVVIDIDDTNYTNLPIVEVNLTTDLTTYNSVKDVIKEIGKSKEFDTIILDGVTSLLELLTSRAKGMAAYSDRSKRWNDILRALLVSKKNIIFVGQIDMELIFTPDAQSSKAVIKVNSMVNEKYYTYIDEKGQYCHETKKFRTIDSPEEYEMAAAPKTRPMQKKQPVKGFETADEIEPTDEQPVLENYAKTVAIKIIQSGDKLNKMNMRKKVFEMVQRGEIDPAIKEDLYEYINENCPGD